MKWWEGESKWKKPLCPEQNLRVRRYIQCCFWLSSFNLRWLYFTSVWPQASSVPLFCSVADCLTSACSVTPNILFHACFHLQVSMTNQKCSWNADGSIHCFHSARSQWAVHWQVPQISGVWWQRTLVLGFHPPCLPQQAFSWLPGEVVMLVFLQH